MRAISLWQPWASYLVSGEKKIETRGWPTQYRGPLLIHAAKTPQECDREERKTLPFGALIGVVHLIDCRRTEEIREKLSNQEYSLGCYGDGRFGWITERPMMFKDPIPYKGQQGFFEVPDSVITGVLHATVIAP